MMKYYKITHQSKFLVKLSKNYEELRNKVFQSFNQAHLMSLNIHCPDHIKMSSQCGFLDTCELLLNFHWLQVPPYLWSPQRPQSPPGQQEPLESSDHPQQGVGRSIPQPPQSWVSGRLLGAGLPQVPPAPLPENGTPVEPFVSILLH